MMARFSQRWFTRRRSPWLVIPAVLGLTLLVWWSICMQWLGYAGWSWPDVPSPVNEISVVDRVTPLDVGGVDRNLPHLVIDSSLDRLGFEAWLTEEFAWGARTWDSPSYRVLYGLKRRGADFDGVTHLASGSIENLYPALDKAIAILPSSNRPESPLLMATVIEGRTANGEPLTVVVARGSGWGDTYPRYEAVFRGSAADIGGESLLAYERFNYDVAGLEGHEQFLQAALLLVLLGLAAALVGLGYFLDWLVRCWGRGRGDSADPASATA